ncbi:MAG: hypothetical protein AMJ79_00855 [Phycisphaerae bacterium SM23_30]|nr:MAG: hypothetical protein AMJ79_00855 [Phycisphaerae bacterium SM23_30]
MRILLSSVGRRGYLVKYFKEALDPGDEVWGADSNKHAPAFQYCDNRALMPKVTEPHYIDQLIRLCQKNRIDMVVPLIDPELEVLAARHQQFDDLGIMAVVSPPQTVQITYDKYLTYQFGKENDIPVPETVTTIPPAKKLLAEGRLSWPLVVKPRNGSASADITYCKNEKQLQYAFENCPNPMIQKYLPGQEYGYDIFSDKNYRPISVFCKLKLAMRAGETDQAVSTDNPRLIKLGLEIAQKIRLFGPMDVDVIMDNGVPKLLEMNPRFGGGYPCSHFAGAKFPAKLISLCKNETLTPDINSCRAGIYMLKQDEIITPCQKSLDAIQNWR